MDIQCITNRPAILSADPVLEVVEKLTRLRRIYCCNFFDGYLYGFLREALPPLTAATMSSMHRSKWFAIIVLSRWLVVTSPPLASKIPIVDARLWDRPPVLIPFGKPPPPSLYHPPLRVRRGDVNGISRHPRRKERDRIGLFLEQVFSHSFVFSASEHVRRRCTKVLAR